ncbi:MAG: TIGR03790 family protein [Verrucomicrobiales bacterium]|nr:TIGR03790 family protein [Verrucomicrobiales bacterium]
MQGSRFKPALALTAAVAIGFPALAAAATPAPASPEAPDDRGQTVVVLYNTAFKGSEDVADHYAERRRVPKKQVIGLKLPVAETIARSEYEKKLERPLLEALQSRDLIEVRDQIRPATDDAPGRVLQILQSAKIRHLVVCYGVPIRTTNDVPGIEPEARQLPEPLQRADACIDAELTALPLLMAGQPRTGPLGNPAYGTTNKAALQPTAGLFVVGRLDGPSPDLAKALVDRALEAEQFGLWGRGYFDIRSVTAPAYKPGDQWISNAWVAVSRYGYDTHLETQPGTLPAGFPLSHVAYYAGWYEANANGPFALPQVEFMPGAVAYHLHSFSAGAVRSPTQTWVGPFVAKGVTATMGCVAEPYLDGTPDIGICVARLMFAGFTWGEAALASQRMLSWQTIVIGDPLYHPYRLNALDRLKDLAARNNGRVDWAMVALYNRRREMTRNLGETLTALEEEPRIRFSPVLREKLGDFEREAGLHEKAALSYRDAAGLRPSPQQRKRLLWNCARSFEAARRPEDAYEVYQQFHREVPNPPEPGLLYERLVALAEALHKPRDAARWSDELRNAGKPHEDPPAKAPTSTNPSGGAEPAGPAEPRAPSKP